ncbi:Putative triphosphatase YjbK [Neobacillus rhizosphaerae]|uniref:Triphosphatase YjbK n=1 Tax=Neobacillus rhizosphaerae TaxID=2880965 RepID=A0ABN8KLZ7_9BACI|nr:CYTH domain-containing protein [Neobacillus rhizosphaerae]CAH2713466.1 Putative triphosphatase YjbK [Neobacillus rhizosphaerae]
MSQHIEIEFKNMLTKEEYERFLMEFKIDEHQIFSQENHYFDTSDFNLKQHDSALRIREKGGVYEMTLKQPAAVGLLETNQALSKEEAGLAIHTGKLPAGIIQNLLEKKDIPFSSIEYFGSLLTKRVEITYKQGLLVLDYSSYLNTDDYEVEYEVENYQEGLQSFQALLAQFTIPFRHTENKIRRFYNQKFKLRDQNG